MQRYSQPYVLIKQALKSGKTIYYYRLRGEKTKHTTGTTRERDAHAFVAQLIEERRRSVSDLTLRQFLDPWFTWDRCPHVRRLRDERRTIGKQHVHNRRRLLEKNVFKDAIAHRPVEALTRADIVDFRSRLLAKMPEQISTVNNTISALKTVFREAVDREELSRDPSAGIGLIRAEREETGILTPDEIKKLFPQEGLGPWKDRRGRACFLLAAATGMRRGEILALRWGDVDFHQGVIRIEQAWKSRDQIGPPKSGKPRLTPLPDVAAKALKDLRLGSIRLGDGDLVFCYDDGGRLGSTWWRRRFEMAMKAAKIDRRARNVKPHSLRHSLATLLEAEDYNPRKIRAALGWSGEGIRENYTHLGAEHLKEQAEIVDRLLGA